MGRIHNLVGDLLNARLVLLLLLLLLLPPLLLLLLNSPQGSRDGPRPTRGVHHVLLLLLGLLLLHGRVWNDIDVILLLLLLLLLLMVL